MKKIPESIYVFRIKTDNAHHIKTISEIISNMVKQSFFKLTSDGIEMNMFDQARKTMLNVSLKKHNFYIYEFNKPESINIGMNSCHFHKMVKSIKKKDSLELFILKESQNVLHIKSIPKDKTRETLSSINISEVQNLELIHPSGYDYSIITPSVDFQKMTKDLCQIGSEKIKIEVNNGKISFTADSDGIMKRVVTFGEEKYESDTRTAYFETSLLEHIIKISALSDVIHIFPYNSFLPIKLKTNVGNIGEMSIYIKSDEIIQREAES